MSADSFLARCEKVKRTGPGRWICCCPAHDDKTPSMNVKELPDGKVLVICRAGCSIQQIIEASGVEWNEFFPQVGNTYAEYRKEARSFPAQEVLAALDFELEIVRIGFSDAISGRPINEADQKRFWQAHKRIQNAIKVARGEH